MKKVILEAKEIKKYFPIKGGFFRKTIANVKAVDNVSFNLYEGETFGLVGESGCGKSTLGRTLIKLYQPSSGEIIYKGENITDFSRAKMKPLRQDIQIIFQDPYSSLNPRMNVSSIISEPLLAHGLYKKGNELTQRVIEILEICGLSSYHMYRYPHQFSGGQRQRIGIARALALNPSFIVCDEPVSALDVSIQSQIINLMMDLQEKMGLSYLFISHNLSVVKHISQRVGVMYLGSLVELADKDDLYKKPSHPYTRVLLAAIPIPNPEHIKDLNTIGGELPSNVNTPVGCKFHTRCPHAQPMCVEQEPAMIEIEKNHFVRCHFAGEI
ncbi:MAG TPA: peptide ABC transporter substrate-binding protein [Clostridiales bacterium]|nr:peptide ABC transporter substrate-binding protein [Clostridiales bacterium]